MHIISHQINCLSDLEKVDYSNGIEIDIRYHNNDLILQHDPFQHQIKKSEKFEDLLSAYMKKHKGTIILNVKSEGIENECIKLMNKYKCDNWFFLDLSMPYFVKYSTIAFQKSIEGFSPENLAVRFSEFEPIEYALAFKNKVRWVWVDCFKTMPLNKINYNILKKANFKICLVAPELQKHDMEDSTKFKDIIRKNNLKLDAVCTKNPKLWK